MVPPCSDRISRVPPYSISPCTSLRVRGFHPLWLPFPEHSTDLCTASRAAPLSLAATDGISVDFFSSGYFDVSVPRVRLPVPMYSAREYPIKSGGFPHSDIPGSQPVYRLPEAFRRLPRPSSPLTAKASALCAYSLDHITRNLHTGHTFIQQQPSHQQLMQKLCYDRFQIFKDLTDKEKENFSCIQRQWVWTLVAGHFSLRR